MAVQQPRWYSLSPHSASKTRYAGRRWAAAMNKLLLTAAFAAALQIVGSAAAQDYPSRPITMIVPFPAGGPSDVVPRILGDRIRAKLGQSILIENVSGAGGSIGMGRVARAAPDGYTVGVGSWSTGVVNGAIYNLPYDVASDFEPVVLLPENPLFMTSKKAIPANKLSELVAWVKANGDKVLVATSGVGTSPHVAGVMLQHLTGAPVQLVHYRGGAPALQDLMSGQVDLNMNQASVFLPYLTDDRIRIYAVLAKTRLPQAPDVPTVDEAGLPGFHLSSWNGIWAPKGTPKDVVGKLNAAVVDALNDPTVRQRFTDLGQVIPPPGQLTPQALGAYQKAEIERWWPIIKAAGITAH
jgi:tripartite-type tricarboxylate transporter receptor subunit TctC